MSVPDSRIDLVNEALLHDAEWVRVEATLNLHADTQASPSG